MSLNTRLTNAEKTINVKVKEEIVICVVMVDDGVYSFDYKDEEFKMNLVEFEKFIELHGIDDKYIIKVIKA